MPTLRTVTLNSGFDDTFVISGLEWGGVGRVHSFASVPSGKGVNAARAAAALGVPVTVYSLVGTADLDCFASALQQEGIEHRLVGVEGSTRHNLTLRMASGEHVAAHLVGRGLRCSSDQAVQELARILVDDCQPGDVVTFNGSVPTGVSAGIWREIAEALVDAGALLVVDVQGEAMRQVLQGAPVTVAAPNDSEIAALPGVDLNRLDPVPAAIRALIGYGVRFPYVTLGAAGVAFHRDGQLVRATCFVDRPVQAVGAGDAFLAGLCSALLVGEKDPAALASAGVAAAAAHVGGLAGDELAAGFQRNLSRVQILPGR